MIKTLEVKKKRAGYAGRCHQIIKKAKGLIGVAHNLTPTQTITIPRITTEDKFSWRMKYLPIGVI
jgi:hypothetical protein